MYYDGSRRANKYLTNDKIIEKLGLEKAKPVIKPFYPDKYCTVTFTALRDKSDKIFTFPQQKVKCGSHATKPDESVIKLPDYSVPVWKFRYDTDGEDSSNACYDLDFDKEIITEDITVELWTTRKRIKVTFKGAYAR